MLLMQTGMDVITNSRSIGVVVVAVVVVVAEVVVVAVVVLVVVVADDEVGVEPSHSPKILVSRESIILLKSSRLNTFLSLEATRYSSLWSTRGGTPIPGRGEN